jgi:hypothetical protein
VVSFELKFIFMKTKTTKEYKWFIQSPSEVMAQQEVRKPSFFLKLKVYRKTG